MRLFVLAALPILSRIAAAASFSPYTLDGVQADISSYLGRNETQQARAVSNFGCDVAIPAPATATSAPSSPAEADRSLKQCGFLAFSRPHTVAFPNSSIYDFQENRYWSQQQELTHPSCRFSPTRAEDVSLAILAFRVTQCKFAVKSGGHGAFSGASNIQNGVTIDLINLVDVELSEDKKIAFAGAGNTWYNVYEKLTPHNLTVIGGRVSPIGVGGLTLGGGISFFSARYGWACDNVYNYQVVLGDGSVRDVNPKSCDKDLYWALRGGGNNFAIVTRFDFETYSQGDMWAGSQTFINTPETSKAINRAFESFAIKSPEDDYAQIITAYAYAQTQGVYVIASDLQYGKPVANPPVLRNFTAIPGAIASTLRVVDLPSLTQEFNATNPYGFRKTYWTFTFKNSAAVMDDIVAIYTEEVEKVKDAPGIVPSAVFQPITTSMTKHFSKNGGNPLGLEGQGPLTLVNIDISWTRIADDKRIMAAAQAIVDRSVTAAKARGLDHPYLYQNYASQKQDVFASYGEANFAKLRRISKKYDPDQVLQRLQPGYFKLH
ncbi:hypothetical protein LLEC1_01072 [Akanthomyces lecanii]|uniref:FAD-binding PCMH-type domain-containing protein n=1 Tax=Cordyceps confragosa TaxID=2714763 RepID=A0A179IAQ2_CORDF|nr:hypothetical protein LLEC1_01072 [Akanthomyces lecanii]